MSRELTSILEAFSICQNEESKRHLRIAAQKSLNEILGIKTKNPKYITLPVRRGDKGQGFRARVPDSDEITIGQIKGKLEAIKKYKDRTGYGLMDSKRVIEYYFEQNNLHFLRD
jgi:ribosomal protein L7/L12